MRTPLLAAAIAILAGCATMRDPAAAEREAALYRQFAQAPVDSFPYSGQYSSFDVVDDTTIALYVTPSRAWLLSINESCSRDLPHATALGLRATTGLVRSRFDHVTLVPGYGPTIYPPCRIEQIRKLDVAAFRAARAQRAAAL